MSALVLCSAVSRAVNAPGGSTGPGPERRPATYRRTQAEATRVRIAVAARNLFSQHGYRMTSMEAIAAEAGVAPRTVYSAYGAKREILSAICEDWLEEAQARAIIGTALAEPSVGRRVRLAAYFLRNLYAHGFDVAQLFDAAAAEDFATRDLLRGKLDGRNHVQDLIVASLGSALVVPLASAQAIYRAMAAPGLYHELVVESGWSDDEYEEWLAELLSRQLLGRRPIRRPDRWPPPLTGTLPG